MFTVKTNKEIQVYKGDSGYLTLFVNKGTRLEPERYSFDGSISVSTNSDLIDVELDYAIWKDKVLIEDCITFIYTDEGWKLDGRGVNLEEFGITVLSYKVYEGDTITVDYRLLPFKSKIYFTITEYNHNPHEPPLLTKVIDFERNQVTGYLYGNELYKVTRNCVDENGDVLIYFEPEDTEYIFEGTYLYQITGKLYNKETLLYDEVTLSNRTPITIIDDDYSERYFE